MKKIKCGHIKIVKDRSFITDEFIEREFEKYCWLYDVCILEVIVETEEEGNIKRVCIKTGKQNFILGPRYYKDLREGNYRKVLYALFEIQQKQIERKKKKLNKTHPLTAEELLKAINDDMKKLFSKTIKPREYNQNILIANALQKLLDEGYSLEEIFNKLHLTVYRGGKQLHIIR